VTAGRIAAIVFAVLVAATIGVLVVSQNVRSRLIVDQVEITNAVTAGEGRGAKIRFRLTEDEDRATVEVLDGDRGVVATLADGEPLGDYEIHRFNWPVGRKVDPGTYRVRLELDSLDRVLVLPEEVDVSRHG
jgi:hypothetical protein